MTFKDIFKSSFMENIKTFSVTDIAIAMIFAVAVGLFVFLIYKKTFQGVMYSEGLALTLPGLTMVTTMVIMAVSSNVVLSLGMVGALSIVRFRTAIKEPMEIVFLFWSLAAGIVIGAGLIPMAVISSVIIGASLLILANRKNDNAPYIIVITLTDQAAEDAVFSILKETTEHCIVKTKSIANDVIELTAEIRLKNMDTGFVRRISSTDGVGSAVLVSYNGQYMS